MAIRLAAVALAAVLAFAPPASATWSIVLVDTQTGEVAIAAATCLENFDLEQVLPVLVVGKGGAVAQSAIDTGATNRKKIFQGLQLGTPPAEILQKVLDEDPVKFTRQYGIVDLSPESVGFTGGAAGKAKKHVNGHFGTITYAIQGNVLAGQEVVFAVEAAVQAASGSLADRLMAGMAAAHDMGGDGRCSCSPTAPDSCGAPPPSFEKSAHIAFAVVARPGDADGGCNTLGCASGQYWLDLNVPHQHKVDPDPVRQLLVLFEDFKRGLVGHPDGLLSIVSPEAAEVAGDGASFVSLDVELHDYSGRPLLRGGSAFTLEHAPGSAGLCSLAGVLDHHDGSYTVTLQAGQGLGTDVLELHVDDGERSATLYPFPTLTQLAAPAPSR